MSKKHPAFKPQSDDYAIIAEAELAIIRGRVDDALAATVKLHLANLKVLDIGTPAYTAAVTSLGKLLIDIKKAAPESKLDKAKLMLELEAWITNDTKQSN